MDRRPSDKPMTRPAAVAAADSAIALLAERLDRWFGWDRLPRSLGVLTLVGLRHRLRERNLYDPGMARHRSDGRPDGRAVSWLERSADGRGTHPADPRIGAAGTRFGRNTPVLPEAGFATRAPSPEAVSKALLQRRDGGFQPAKTLNVLAAAWLQFEVHDWFAHQVELDEHGNLVRGPLGLPPLRRDPDSAASLPMYLSDQTHWWDASQLYGANDEFAEAMRCESWERTGRVKVDERLLEEIAKFVDPSGPPAAGQSPRPPHPVPALWVGLALFHVVFAREHNALCDLLHVAYPDWTGERLYAKARLINVAVMAKIHTVEWTPALIAHPTTVHGIHATWWGLLGERFRRRFGRIGAGEVLSGIPGSQRDDEVPYAITEDFVAVYRLHPLIPDEVTFLRAADGAPMTNLVGGPTLPFEDLAATPEHLNRAGAMLEHIEYPNAWYSLGHAYPGALTLHNHPTAFAPKLPNGVQLDFGTADVLRMRECGVPRYNEFRRSLRMRPAGSFHELADGNETFAREIEQLYGSVEDVDLVVGLMADRKPAGFAISDTAFRIFLLMAARRLRSDPFFTTHYKPSVYTRVGMRWIENATMGGILRRHYPELEPALRTVDNPFQPWQGQ
jgi:hypothetical protein